MNENRRRKRRRTPGVAGCLALVLALLALPGRVAAQAPSPAGAFSEAQVAAAVQTWVRRVPADARPDAEIEALEPYRAADETVAYIVRLKGGGFVLAGANPTVLPVYFYSPGGTYQADNRDDQIILAEIGRRTAAGRQALAGTDAATQALREALAGRAEDWAGLIAGRAPARPAAPGLVAAEPAKLVLPLTAQWHQGAPYFDQLPVLPGTTQHTVVGCNATATVQIMYYWKWPPSGAGSSCVSYPYRMRANWDWTALATAVTISADFVNRLEYDAIHSRLRINGSWDNSIYASAQGISADAAYQTALATLWNNMSVLGTLTSCADFGAASYNWSIMRDTNTEPPDAAGMEAAKISAHTSIGVDSGLGVWGTGSSFGNDVPGLIDHFRYDSDALFTPVATIGAITEDLLWGRPAGLGGSSPDGGHAWVIDGYDKSTDPNRLFHMNLGWGGSSDGWYTFDTAPFPNNHDMMTRVAPLVVKFANPGTALAGDGTPGTPYGGIAAAAAAIPAGNTLMLSAGSEYNFVGTPLVINKAMTIKAFGATIR